MVIGYLHDKKIVYRDLKPANTLIDEDGYLFLTDFGLAKMIDENSEVDENIYGTREYMAPEIFTSKQGYGFEVDWWAVGIVLYEIIVGFRPFDDPEYDDNKTVSNIILKEVNFTD